MMHSAGAAARESDASELGALKEDDASWSTSPRNPRNWSPTRRWANIVVLSLTNIIAGMTPAFEPALDAMMRDFGSTDQALKSLAVSVYVIAYVVGPLFIAPVSEVLGRVWILRAAYVLFVAMLVACALSTTLSAFVACRAFMGLAGIVFVVLGPAMVPDLTGPAHRGLALGLMTIGQTTGMTLGPVVGGAIAQRTTWRWILGAFAIAFGVLAIIALGLIRETHAPILRRGKAPLVRPTDAGAKPGSWLGRAGRSPWMRPLRLLVTSPIVLLLSLFSTLNVGYLLLVVATLGLVFQRQYGFSPAASGLAYLGMTLGILVSQLWLGRLSDAYVARRRRGGGSRPEDRLAWLILGAALMPAGLFAYGWGLHTHWIVPVLGTLVLGVGIVLSWLPVTIYLVEIFGGEQAASANGVRTMVQSVAGALLPLAADPLYGRLGYAWGNSVLAFVALAFLPFAVGLVRYGGRLRAWEEARRGRRRSGD